MEEAALLDRAALRRGAAQMGVAALEWGAALLGEAAPLVLEVF